MRVSCTRDSSHPHAVTSTSKGYSAAYDASGNMTCRATTAASTCSGSSPTGQQLSYDAEGRLSLWQNQPTSPTQTVNYLYDGSGNRVAMQSTVNGTTTLTSYIGSIEEVQTSGGSTQTTTYYSVEGKRVAADVNGTFYYFGYDALGSQVAVLDAAGHLVGAQLYSPYGNSRYNNGTLPTSIGFTGQRADSVTGLDYYVARYYDPNVGQFLSADSVQGNTVGMDPYAYVGGNPETRTDPTGRMFVNPGSLGGGGGDGGGGTVAPYGGGCPSHGFAPAGCGGGTADGYTGPAHGYIPPTPTQVVAIAHGFTQHKPPVFGQPGSSMTPLLYMYLFRYQAYIRMEAALNQEGMSMSQNLVHDAYQFMDEVNEVDRNLWNLNDDTVALFRHINALLIKSVPIGMRAVNEFGGLDEGGLCGGGLSFEASTKVATTQGEQAIGTLKVGEKVWAYNPKTHKMELQPIVHVWINHDNDLVDLTLTITTHSAHGTLKKSEVLHTNKRHPFLTMEQGFLPVSRLTLGMHVERANGSVGVVTGWSIVAGAKTMYNLEVAQDHTFTVGDGQWVVHNCGWDGDSVEDYPGAVPVGKLSRVNDNYIKQNGVDAHRLKDDIPLDGPGSRFNLYKDRDGWLFKVPNGKNPATFAVDTGFNIYDYMND